VNIFLDTSVILAACGSRAGASRAIFNAAVDHGWSLLTSDYVLSEVAVNLPALPSDADVQWVHLRRNLAKVPDVLTFEWATVFAPCKDRPLYRRRLGRRAAHVGPA
jgi:predicted nucleic acid-binding protein